MQFPQNSLNNSPYFPYQPNYPFIPSFDQLAAAFRNIHQQQEKYFIQLFHEYQQFCLSRNLVEGDLNTLNFYYRNKFPISTNPITNPNTISFPNSITNKNTMPIPNNKNMQSTNSNIYINEPKSIFPRKVEELYEGPKGSEDQNLMNIAFLVPSGHKVVFVVKGNTTVNELIIKYMSKLGLSYDYIKNREVEFLYGAQRIDPFSKVPISSVFINNIIIHVIERRIVIGA